MFLKVKSLKKKFWIELPTPPFFHNWPVTFLGGKKQRRKNKIRLGTTLLCYIWTIKNFYKNIYLTDLNLDQGWDNEITFLFLKKQDLLMIQYSFTCSHCSLGIDGSSFYGE